MSKDNNNNEKKDQTVRFRASNAFLEMLQAKMKEAKIGSLSDYIRSSIKDSQVLERCDQLQKVLYELNRMGNNLNQIARYTNKNKAIDENVHLEIEKISTDLNYLFEELFHAGQDV